MNTEQQKSRQRAANLIRKNTIPGGVVKSYEVPEALIKLRDKFQNLGYLTSFDAHHRYQAYPRASAFNLMDARLHMTKAMVLIWQHPITDYAICSLFHPKQALPIHIHFDTSGEYASVYCGNKHEDDSTEPYTEHYTTLDEILADHRPDYEEWDEAYQRLIFEARKPDLAYLPIKKPLTDEEFSAMMAELKASDERFAEKLEEVKVAIPAEGTDVPENSENIQ